MISGGLVVLSFIPYAIRTHQGKIHPAITSWALWSIIGFTLLLTYKSSGAENNVWPAIFGFTNPTLIVIIAFTRKGQRTKMDRVDKWCMFLCGVSLIMWLYMRDKPEFIQYALYVAILADSIASGPTFKVLLKNPERDRPISWGIFALGYGLAFFAIPEYTFANYFLPIYMAIGNGSVAFILVVYRIKNKTPLREWI
jgi:hypothetical protein